MHITGLLGQPRRTYTYSSGLGWDIWNLLETVGTLVLALGILVTLVAWWRSTKRGPVASNNPWDGDTLEWATTSPPPPYNFASIPTVRSREPVWDQPDLRDGAQPASAGGRELAEGHVTLATSLLDASPEAIVHMPHSSPWPFFLTVALTILFFGFLARALPLVSLGGVGVIVGIFGWLWPRGETQET
jgi:heme/copper-type cytochrome/quinol oxidase subunit 1